VRRLAPDSPDDHLLPRLVHVVEHPELAHPQLPDGRGRLEGRHEVHELLAVPAFDGRLGRELTLNGGQDRLPIEGPHGAELLLRRRGDLDAVHAFILAYASRIVKYRTTARKHATFSGARFEKSQSEFPQPTLGTGQEKDKETATTSDATGEMHYRARAYSPRQMRFVQNDPPVIRRAEAHYAYLQDAPTNATDSSGQGPQPPVGDPFRALSETAIVGVSQALNEWLAETLGNRPGESERIAEKHQERMSWFTLPGAHELLADALYIEHARECSRCRSPLFETFEVPNAYIAKAENTRLQEAADAERSNAEGFLFDVALFVVTAGIEYSATKLATSIGTRLATRRAAAVAPRITRFALGGARAEWPKWEGAQTEKIFSFEAGVGPNQLKIIPNLVWINDVSARFAGLEVRMLYDLSHVSDAQLRFIIDSKYHPAPRVPGKSQPIVLHHFEQRAAGPILELAESVHIENSGQLHPLGNKGGIGRDARLAHPNWRQDYWVARARDELARRALVPK